MGKDTASISVGNPKLNETYAAYRLFELAAFEESTGSRESNEQALSAGKHGVNDENEVYAYVIDTNSPWYTFLTENGPDGHVSADNETGPYAAMSDDSNPQTAYF